MFKLAHKVWDHLAFASWQIQRTFTAHVYVRYNYGRNCNSTKESAIQNLLSFVEIVYEPQAIHVLLNVDELWKNFHL